MELYPKKLNGDQPQNLVDSFTYKNESPQKEKDIGFEELNGEIKQYEIQLLAKDNQIRTLKRQLQEKEIHIDELYNKLKKLESESRRGTPELSLQKPLLDPKQVTRRNPARKSDTKELETAISFSMHHVLVATKNFHISQKIGESAFGEIFKARFAHVPVTITRIHDQVIQNKPDLLNEIEIISRFHHPLLITLFGHTDLSDARPCLIEPLLPQGSLRDRLDCKENTPPIPWSLRLKIVWQIVNAMDFLRETRVMKADFHLFDLKSDGVLLDHSFDAKVSVLGLLESVVQNQQTETQASSKTVVFSIGVILAELVSGKPPIMRPPRSRPIFLSRLFCDHMISPTTSIPESLIDPFVVSAWPAAQVQAVAQLTRECLDVDPNNRPYFHQLLGKIQEIMREKSGICLLCLQPLGSRNKAAEVQCRHDVMCQLCAAYLLERGEGCPLCRSPINAFMVQNGGGNSHSTSMAFVPLES